MFSEMIKSKSGEDDEVSDSQFFSDPVVLDQIESIIKSFNTAQENLKKLPIFPTSTPSYGASSQELKEKILDELFQSLPTEVRSKQMRFSSSSANLDDNVNVDAVEDFTNYDCGQDNLDNMGEENADDDDDGKDNKSGSEDHPDDSGEEQTDGDDVDGSEKVSLGSDVGEDEDCSERVALGSDIGDQLEKGTNTDHIDSISGNEENLASGDNGSSDEEFGSDEENELDKVIETACSVQSSHSFSFVYKEKNMDKFRFFSQFGRSYSKLFKSHFSIEQCEVLDFCFYSNSDFNENLLMPSGSDVCSPNDMLVSFDGPACVSK